MAEIKHNTPFSSPYISKPEIPISSVLITLIVLTAVFLLNGCVNHPSVKERIASATNLALQNDFKMVDIKTDDFILRAYVRNKPDENGLVHVYIEGDGLAWNDRYSVSADPTPVIPLGLKLAVSDTDNSVIYLSRPCQYILNANIHTCSQKLWTTHRYSEEVIKTMNQAITILLGRIGGHRDIGIIGYSGGGAIGAMLAMRRKEIRWLIAVSGNMDHQKWTAFHEVDPLTGSYNPALYASQIGVKQVLFVGGKDSIIPRRLIQEYAKRSKFTTIVEIEGYTHSCCWSDEWKHLLQRALSILQSPK